jgi:hypothetical protein
MVVATHEGLTWAIEHEMQGELPVRVVAKPGVCFERFDISDERWVFVANIVPGSIRIHRKG